MYAEFRHGPVPRLGDEAGAGEDRLRLPGRGLDAGACRFPRSTVCGPAGDGLVDEDSEALEQYMLGRQGQDFVMCEPEKAPNPWAAYDKLFGKKGLPHEQAVDKIFNIVEDTGIDPQVVIDYESENQQPGRRDPDDVEPGWRPRSRRKTGTS